MRDVAHPAGNFANQTPSFVADGSAAVENSGDGGDGHLRFTGDILDRDHSPRECGPELDHYRNRGGAEKTAELLADLCQERLQYVIVYIEGARPSSDLPVILLPPFPRSGSRSNFRG